MVWEVLHVHTIKYRTNVHILTNFLFFCETLDTMTS
jgi:hypothetical protein